MSSDFAYDDATHIYRLNGQEMPSVTFVLDAMGFISNFAKKEEYRIRGQIVHKALALYGAGKLDWSTVDPRILGYVLSGAQFYEEMKFEPMELEAPSYHTDYLYGFTADGVGQSRVGPLLPDFKTGIAPKIATTLQLAAYKNPLDRKYKERFKTVAVELDEAGGMPNLRFLGNDRKDWIDFIACLTVFRLKEAHDGSAITVPSKSGSGTDPDSRFQRA